MRPEHIKNLNLFLGAVLTVVVILVAIRSYTIFEGSSELRPESSFEMDPVVRITADSLESRMRDLARYTFEADADPLRLSRVVITKEEMQARRFREREEGLLVRLSATVVDEEPKAVIKYKDRSYVVGVGDTLAGSYLVTDISYKRATLSHNGEEIVLETRPMWEKPEYEESQQPADSLSGQANKREEF